MSLRAELAADEGAAAASPDDFFRSPQFLAAEGVTHTLRVTDALAVPLVVRAIEGSGLRDATSPYGYPGAAARGEPLDPAAVDWSGAALVSAFLRERVGGEPCLTGATERSWVQLHDPARSRGTRRRLVEQIRANERAGVSIEAVPGPEAPPDARAGFIRAYDETMRRARAAERYLYPAAYFEAILAFPRSWLVVAREGAGHVVAGSIAAVSDGLLHYYLGGTADAALERSPFKNVVAAMLDLADELGMPLNLGGGVRAGDGLERFKRGFANSELPFRTHELVLDPHAYAELSRGRDPGEFFPAYRA